MNLEHRLSYRPETNPHWQGPGATAPRWHSFLRSQVPNPHERRLLRQWFGYLLPGGNMLMKLLVISGPRASGKTVICDTMERLISTRLVYEAPLEFLGLRHNVSQLIGASLMISREPRDLSDDALLNLKGILGGDPQTVESKSGMFYVATIPTQFVIETESGIPDDWGIAMRKRTLVVSTDGPVPEDQLVTNLVDRFDMGGILAWAVEGLQELREKGGFTRTRGPSHDESGEIDRWPLVTDPVGRCPNYEPQPGYGGPIVWYECLGPRFRGFVWRLEGHGDYVRRTPASPLLWLDPDARTPETPPVLDHEPDDGYVLRIADAVLMAPGNE